MKEFLRKKNIWMRRCQWRTKSFIWQNVIRDKHILNVESPTCNWVTFLISIWSTVWPHVLYLTNGFQTCDLFYSNFVTKVFVFCWAKTKETKHFDSNSSSFITGDHHQQQTQKTFIFPKKIQHFLPFFVKKRLFHFVRFRITKYDQSVFFPLIYTLNFTSKTLI